MIWPGTSDPYKRKKTLRFLAVSAGVGAAAVLFTVLVVNPFIGSQPHSACINDIERNWKISFTVELHVDGHKLEIPPDVGFMDGGCQRAIYTTSGDGSAHAEWREEAAFEIGHFFWIAEFPLKDMEQSKSRILVDGTESERFIAHPLQDGVHYRAEFTSKEHDDSEDGDFLPP